MMMMMCVVMWHTSRLSRLSPPARRSSRSRQVKGTDAQKCIIIRWMYVSTDKKIRNSRRSVQILFRFVWYSIGEVSSVSFFHGLFFGASGVALVLFVVCCDPSIAYKGSNKDYSSQNNEKARESPRKRKKRWAQYRFCSAYPWFMIR